MEQRALTSVPADERQHWLSVAAIQAGYMVSVTSLWTGALIVTSLSLNETVVAGTIGYLIVVGLSVLMGMQGSDLGVPTIAASTSAFGEKGARWLISTLLIASLVGRFAINANLVGAAFSGLLGESFGVEVPVLVSTVGWGLVMLATAVIGFGGLKVLNVVGVPIMVVVCAIGVWIGVSRHGLSALQQAEPDGQMSMVAVIGVVVGGYAVGALTAADVTRYQRTRRDVVKSVTLGILPAGVALLCAGAVLSVVAGTEDLAKIFVSVGMPLLGVLGVVLSTWAANAGDAYSAGLDVVKLGGLGEHRRALATALCGGVGVVLACLGIVDHFASVMVYLGIAITPLCGVMIADYWWVRRGEARAWRPVEGWNLAGIVAAVAGAGVAVAVQRAADTGSAPWAAAWLIPSVAGVVVAAVAYPVLLRAGRSAGRSAGHPSEHVRGVHEAAS